MKKREHKIGDRVSIIRDRHGWYDGSVHGEVKNVSYRSGGAAQYEVKGDDGHDYEVRSTKDLISKNQNR